MRPISPASCLEEQLYVAPQVIETFGRGGRASLRLRQDEAALDQRLGVQGEALRRPILRAPMFAHRRANVGLERPRVAADGPLAGSADVRMGPVGLLNDRADKASEIRSVAGQEGFAKLDIRDHAAERVLGVVV